ncbi:AAA family ATPase [Streptomyces sp. NPDC057445]|uniref:AAA family ATPase n=1 Tax=Streptomyces sp. NPDC057445 TaxID=3346136 RepID=UPI00368D46A0
MQFTVLEYEEAPPADLGGAFLTKDNWNDFGFVTTFVLEVRQEHGPLLHIGHVRIAHMDMETDDGFVRTSDRMPTSFTRLPEGYFSLAQEDDYYEALRLLPPGTDGAILSALHDVGYTEGLWRAVHELQVFKKSLRRGYTPHELDRVMSIAAGERARVVPFHLAYIPPANGLLEPPTFTFDAEPGSLPSTNLHALIGRNGVGKSYLLHDIAQQVMAGSIRVTDGPHAFRKPLSGCVVVSFSPFDQPYETADDPGLPFDYVGLRHGDELRLKTDDELRDEFVRSFDAVRVGARGIRWRKAVRTLSYAASGFLDSYEDAIENLMRASLGRVQSEMGPIFESLSSGHKVALLTVTRLVEVVAERTIVLIDEPETHLHPPLLAALMRSVSDLLTDRNGMAIMATHSPVVLQEVPASCVWKLHRNGAELTAHRPALETYGENIGELTHEVFGLEVTSTGYHAAIAELVEQGLSYEEIATRFTALGSEARGLLRAMTFVRAREHKD